MAMHDRGARSPNANEEDRALFRTLVPEDDRVTVKPMFGAVAAFANPESVHRWGQKALDYTLTLPPKRKS